MCLCASYVITMNCKWTAFIWRLSNQWPLMCFTILPNIHLFIHTVIHTFTHIFSARRGCQPY